MNLALEKHEDVLAKAISSVIQADNGGYGKQLDYSCRKIEEGIKEYLISISTDSEMTVEEKGIVMSVTGSISKALVRSLRPNAISGGKTKMPELKSNR